MNQSFIRELISTYENIFFYLFIVLILSIFLISINFNIKNFSQKIKKLIKVIFRNNEKNYTNKKKIKNKYNPQKEIKKLKQEDLSFIKAEDNQ